MVFFVRSYRATEEPEVPRCPRLRAGPGLRSGAGPGLRSGAGPGLRSGPGPRTRQRRQRTEEDV